MTTTRATRRLTTPTSPSLLPVSAFQVFLSRSGALLLSSPILSFRNPEDCQMGQIITEETIIDTDIVIRHTCLSHLDLNPWGLEWQKPCEQGDEPLEPLCQASSLKLGRKSPQDLQNILLMSWLISSSSLSTVKLKLRSC